MSELLHYLVALPLLVAAIWLFPKFHDLFEHVFGEVGLMPWLKRRNRPVTLFGKNDQDVL
jgi:hypothetical protein